MEPFLLHKKKHLDVKGTPSEAQQQGQHNKREQQGNSSQTSVWPPPDRCCMFLSQNRTQDIRSVRVSKNSPIQRQVQKDTT